MSRSVAEFKSKTFRREQTNDSRFSPACAHYSQRQRMEAEALVMNTYAKNTSVSVEKSRAEIESTLTRFGASAFAYATQNNKAMLKFQAQDRWIMFILDLPDRYDKQFTNRTHGNRVTSDKLPDQKAYEKWESACREKWRALALVIKAKLVAVQDGITQFEDEFMAHIVMPDGKTVSHFMRPQIQEAYSTGKMPLALEFK